MNIICAKMNKFTERREIFFSNLLLLEFDIKKTQKLHEIPFHKDMFDVPNIKGFQVITHFLFTKLKSVSSKDFSIVWPLLTPSDEQEFRKTCYKYLLLIVGDNSGVKFPRIVQSMLHSPGGERFYEFYLPFTTYVLHQCILKDGVCEVLRMPTVTSENHQNVEEILLLGIITATKEFRETQQKTLYYEKKWEDQAMLHTNSYRKKKAKNNELQKAMIEKSSSIPTLYSKNENTYLSRQADGQQLYIDLQNQLKELIELDKVLETDLRKDESSWEIIRTELGSENAEKIILDGKNFINTFPPNLPDELKNKLQEKNIQSVLKEGKLSVKSFLEVMHVYLEYYKHVFNKVGFPNTNGLKSLYEKHCQTLECSLSIATSLSEKMSSNILPNLMNNVKCLEVDVYSDVSGSENPFIELIAEAPPLSFPSLSECAEECSLLFSNSPPKDFEQYSVKNKSVYQPLSQLLPKNSDSDVNSKKQNAEEHNVVKRVQTSLIPRRVAKYKVVPEYNYSLIPGEDTAATADINIWSSDDCLPEAERDINVLACIDQFQKFCEPSICSPQNSSKSIENDFGRNELSLETDSLLLDDFTLGDDEEFLSDAD